MENRVLDSKNSWNWKQLQKRTLDNSVNIVHFCIQYWTNMYLQPRYLFQITQPILWLRGSYCRRINFSDLTQFFPTVRLSEQQNDETKYLYIGTWMRHKIVSSYSITGLLAIWLVLYALAHTLHVPKIFLGCLWRKVNCVNLKNSDESSDQRWYKP